MLRPQIFSASTRPPEASFHVAHHELRGGDSVAVGEKHFESEGKEALKTISFYGFPWDFLGFSLVERPTSKR